MVRSSVNSEWEEQDWTPTDLTPLSLDRALDKNSFLIDKWNKMFAWHRAQRDYLYTEFVKAEAGAVMRYTGPATKAKYHAMDTQAVIMAKTYLDIANAQLGICERRLHSLEKEAINLALRNKLLSALYNNGGGNY
ncbi:Uncharacterised protein [Mycobacteroides abscessus subsp. massiliense]|nr:Uncharacterised protein [Mycobacteroides abscessus subsp. massiliense]